MSERTGLGALETRLLRAAGETASPRRTLPMLDQLDHEEQVGPSYAVLALRDLGAAWTTTLQLFDLKGNWGSASGDDMAAPRYTELGLTRAGRVALGAELGELGPVPAGLIVGSAYRGGRVPPLDALATITALRARIAGAEVSDDDLSRLVRLPSGGLVVEGLDDVVAGHETTVVLTSPIERCTDEDGRAYLRIHGLPPGVGVDELAETVASRLAHRFRPLEDYADYEPVPTDDFYEHFPITPVLGAELHDYTSRGTDIDVRVVIMNEEDTVLLSELEAWVRSIWPVTIETTWHVRGGLGARLDSWATACEADPSGLDALETALLNA